MVGITISHYRIIEKLYDGGMGIVYKAEDTLLKRSVIIKFLPRELISDAQSYEQFIKEAQITSAIDHVNICTVHEIGHTDDGQMFISMAHYQGETISRLIEQDQLSIERTVRLAIQIATGLKHIHEMGVVHGDIKTSNMILTSDEVVKILDFGLAKFRDDKHVYSNRKSFGTAAYMSPEQIRGEIYDHRTDIWSVGVCLYEMITGKMPFDGDYEQALLYSIITDEAPPVNRSKITNGTEQEIEKITKIDRIIHKCLEKRVQDRYQTIEGLLIDLNCLTPETKKNNAKYSSIRHPLRNIKPFYRIVSIVVVLIIIFITSKIITTKDHMIERKAIVILPFKNLNADAENEYFSDGITEDVINQVSKISELTVISRTSAMRYKNSDKSIRDIGRELNVGVVLEGSVRRTADRVRIVSQLIDVKTDTHIWSESYDRPLVDIFEIQSAVALSIAKAMRLKLGSDSVNIIMQKPIGKITAYEYDLKGREYYYRFRKEDNEKAILFFKKAIDIEPSYAIALSGLSDAYSQRVAKFGFSTNWIDSALAMSNMAISYDRNLSDAYKALGLAYSGKGWHSKAVEYYLKSIELNPNNFIAIGNIGAEYSFLGKYDLALIWFKKAVPLNPIFPFSYYTVGGTYSNLENSKKAEEWFAKCLQIEPDFQFVHAGLCILQLRQGNIKRAYDEAMEILSKAPNDLEGITLAGWSKIFSGDLKAAKVIFEKAVSIDSTNSYWYGCGRSNNTALGYINLVSGNQSEAKRFLDLSRKLDYYQLKQQSEWHTIRYDLALINVLEGNKDEAYRWLNEAVDAGWREYKLAEQDPLLATLRGNDEFNDIIEKVKIMVRDMRLKVVE